uniref:Tryptophan 2,3-dioxygenase n=1 Tax=Candidatus Kentrum eta TaxID=2126337 RepID=A0A450UZM1_9GAMM|nr:MAG: tryptophan 2,3-dioxygenase [Candidatus Kentron sp. H]VFJ97983.1 MAG: tryptophan 2,3-dioxygenase [Candidatus Kentron sp. H]VFK03121.1 MAG: tryptophan 2,3-dioxygenase [Candidatus Kentron sp. H]
MAPTYDSYLMLDRLLDLQRPLSHPEEHDELMFIILHQIHELWFKLLLRECKKAGTGLSAGDLDEAIATFGRMGAIMKTLAGQFHVLETMTPLSFLSFRDRLGSASGLQSAQFRELEFVLGYKRPEMLHHHPAGSLRRKELARGLNEPSLVDRFYDFLEGQGVEIPATLRNQPPAQPNRPDGAIQHALVRLYKEKSDVGRLLEAMMDFDEGFQAWRYRHVKMVERVIGDKRGTGGTSGVAYLKATLFRPVFPDLWAIRHGM